MGLRTDIDLARAQFASAQKDLATATVLLAGRLTMEHRGKLLGILASQIDTPSERLMAWCLRYGQRAQRGPVHAYVAFHGDPDVQELCAVADGLEPSAIGGEYFERSLMAAQEALRGYQDQLGIGRLRSDIGRNN